MPFKKKPSVSQAGCSFSIFPPIALFKLLIEQIRVALEVDGGPVCSDPDNEFAVRGAILFGRFTAAQVSAEHSEHSGRVSDRPAAGPVAHLRAAHLHLTALNLALTICTLALL